MLPLTIQQAIALSVDYQRKGQLENAIAALRQVIALDPNHGGAYCNLGIFLRDVGQFDEAIAALNRAIELDSALPEAYCNLGIVLKDTGQIDQSIAAFRKAAALRPEYANAHFNLGLALLMNGDFAAGWKEYQWRWNRKDFQSSLVSQPQWDGSRLEGRTILLHAEQGFGDTIQFIRYLPAVARMGGRIILVCQPELRRLLQSIAGGCQMFVPGQSVPRFDVQCPLLSLPCIFNTALASIPAETPYLKADLHESLKWRQRLSGHSQIARVGLAWAGRPSHHNDRNRSISFDRFAALIPTPGFRFYSLQKRDAAEKRPQIPETESIIEESNSSERLRTGVVGKSPGGEAASQQTKAFSNSMDLVDWTDDLNDFADTAALIEQLDLVITVDTAIAHLAGAMGKPAWTLLPFIADWRWMRERRDSPWYPSMRLFRQPARGDWDSVIAQVADALTIFRSSQSTA